VDLEKNPSIAARLCRESHAELSRQVSGLDDEIMCKNSRLPGWTVGHVLTHLARNADAHSRRLAGALNGEDVPKYANGPEQRRQEIEDGARRTAAEILADLESSNRQLDMLLEQCEQERWPNADFVGGGHYGAGGCPAHRLREVQMHLVDLGLGYTPSRWPKEYVEWDLDNLLASVPERLASSKARTELVAWLAGRSPLNEDFALEPWG